MRNEWRLGAPGIEKSESATAPESQQSGAPPLCASLRSRHDREAISRCHPSARDVADPSCEFFKVDDQSSRRWALGQPEIPEAVAMLPRLMIRLRLKPEQLTEKEFDRIIKL